MIDAAKSLAPDSEGHRNSRLRARAFLAGSMGPEVEAVCRFTEATGEMAAIGDWPMQALIAQQAGTIITF